MGTATQNTLAKSVSPNRADESVPMNLAPLPTVRILAQRCRQVGPGIAAFLDLPVASYIGGMESIDTEANVCRCQRLNRA